MAIFIIISSIITYFLIGIGYYLVIRKLDEIADWGLVDSYGDMNDPAGYWILGAGSVLWPIALICWISSSPLLFGKLIYKHWIEKK